MGISGAMRRDELTKMSIDDIKDEHSVLIVAVPDTKTGIKRTFIFEKVIINARLKRHSLE
jgi:hypothetical protein